MDDFKDDFWSEINNFTNKDRLNHILWYVPALNIYLLFVKKTDEKEESKKYSKQWIALFLIYIIWFIVLWIISFTLSKILTLIYFVVIIFLAAKAYNQIYYEIDILEKIANSFIEMSKKNNFNKNEINKELKNEQKDDKIFK